MRRYSLHPWLLGALGAIALAGLIALPAPTRAEDDTDEQQEKAIKDAVKKISDSVVKIETSGGTETVRSGPRGTIRRGVGPTTGLIVSPDGFIISSAFNFANKPATIRVAIPGLKERRVARVIATDQTRMLTLLKVIDLPSGHKLPVPQATPKKEIEIGLTAIAVGRTLTPEVDGPTSVSVGIISAVDRIWGKAIQTDAKVSPTNYGGPLVDLHGRVQGVLVPASPQAEGETAGFEWYDSGIGFAIPLEDVNAVLPRMMKGTEKEPVVLKRGFMGINMRSLDMYEAQPIVGTVMPGSAAEKAGLKPGDLVKGVDGKAVVNYAQVMHRLGNRYEGDTVSIKVERDKKEIEFAKVVLGSAEAAFPQAFLGILPIRDDPEAGVEIRYVYPKSPAESAKLAEGDRIMKMTPPQAPPAAPLLPITRGRDQLAALLETARPGQEVKVEVKRKATGKTETVSVKLGELPDVVPAKLPENSTAKKALTRPGEKPVKPGDKKPADKKPPMPPMKPETGMQKKTTPAADHTYWLYVPDNYDPNIAYSLVVWLHPLGKNKERDIEDFVSSWTNYCDDNNIILLCPQSEDTVRAWTPGEADFVVQTVRTVTGTYTVDQRRIVVHGMGVGGEMAFYLGFQSRSLFRGVATVSAYMGSNPREKVPNQPLSFFLVVGGKDPLKPAVQQTKEKLNKYKYSVIEREITNMGVEYIDGRAGQPTLEEMIRWIDALDRM
jgi:S1-C subfamily serine protease